MDRYRGRVSISRGMIPFLALHVASEYHRLRRKPPVTAGLILANTLIYLRPGMLHRLLPLIDEVSFNPHLIVKYGDLKRLFLSAFYHLNDSHLVYNMMSLLWKGIQLESSMGSVEFASMVAALLGLSQGITLILAKSLVIFDYEEAYYNQYAVGFSGVLFAMKVVLNSQSDGYTFLHGVLIPTRYAAWAELILIQLFVPRVSFIGHLGGILAGLLYLKLRETFSRPSPLAALMTSMVAAVSWPFKFLRRLISLPHRRILGRGRVGGGAYGYGTWRCSACTYDNSASVDVCEMCSTERFDHGFSTRQPYSNNEPSLEEVRRRRLERFNR
ncbi:hypothetical protein HPP92_012358 [Vanilla planifolia]|uniref:RanBP2-type domain-containing protein n=1 Tax=Vanilla planifolia TaxID=51239 RepID=A0A835UVR4_VANPL|nr:hypothetical protein HPP92_012358 [Vanilla planifolia]